MSWMMHLTGTTQGYVDNDGWRFNPRNQTVVCPNCALIINKKGDKNEDDL